MVDTVCSVFIHVVMSLFLGVRRLTVEDVLQALGHRSLHSLCAVGLKPLVDCCNTMVSNINSCWKELRWTEIQSYV